MNENRAFIEAHRVRRLRLIPRPSMLLFLSSAETERWERFRRWWSEDTAVFDEDQAKAVMRIGSANLFARFLVAHVSLVCGAITYQIWAALGMTITAGIAVFQYARARAEFRRLLDSVCSQCGRLNTSARRPCGCRDHVPVTDGRYR